VDGEDPRCSRMFYFFRCCPISSSDFFSSSPMFFIKNETSCSIQSLMRPLLRFAQVLAKHHQQPHTDPQLHNLSSHCYLFLPVPHSQCPKMTFLNRVRCFRSNLSRLSTLLFLFFLFLVSCVVHLYPLFIYLSSFLLRSQPT
jgi:hypothetical protein